MMTNVKNRNLKVQTINHILDVIIWWIKLRKFAPIVIESQNQTIGISFLL